MLTDYPNLTAETPDAHGLLPLPAAESAALVRRMNQHLPAFPLDPATTIVRAGMLPFYASYRLCSLTDLATLPPYELAGLYRPRDVVLLDGSLASVLEANRRDGLRLSRDTVATYVSFLFKVLRSEDVPLILTAPPALRTPAGAAAWSLDVAFNSGAEAATARLDLDREGRPSFAEVKPVGQP